MSTPQPAPTLETLLREARAHGASDLHICVTMPPMVRLNGELCALPNRAELSNADISNLIAPILEDAEALRKTLLEEKSVDFSHPMGDIGRFRVNIFNQQGSLGGVFRHIPERVPGLDKVAAPHPLLQFVDQHMGLVLVTGPTGSGKSTTLAALIDVINTKRASHILTIEDPIEFVHKPKRSIVNQREIGRDAPSFQRALRDALREDPDVILVGEMRDLETTKIALTAAETGHLVFATLHTRDVPSTIERIIDQFPGDEKEHVRVQLAGALQGIVTQALLPRAEGNGRVACHEVLIVDQAIRATIRNGDSSSQIRSMLQTKSDIGCQTMEKALAHYVMTGVLDHNVARERAINFKEFDMLISQSRAGKAVQVPRLVQASDLPAPMALNMLGATPARPTAPAPAAPNGAQTMGGNGVAAPMGTAPAAPPPAAPRSAQPMGGGQSMGGGQQMGGGHPLDDDDDDMPPSIFAVGDED